MHILLVEDDKEITNLLYFYLTRHGWKVTSCETYQEAIKQIDSTVSICVLDLMLPDGDGLELLVDIKKQYPDLPSIIISAKTSSLDRVRGFEIGTDDYVTKPFLPEELIYRISKLTHLRMNHSLVEIQNYIVNEQQRAIFDGSSKLSLSTKELDTLFYLIHNKGTALSREQIIAAVWEDDSFVNDRIIDNQIKNLRKKMPRLVIDTLYGYGYRMNG
ncbi:MAG: response regulator transcription factor [Carnobacterium sp.]|uniref:response regulator transcription factor n=1 Tax=Carnobacterium sp. TaxID=48221 RepID=UPI003C75A6E4